MCLVLHVYLCDICLLYFHTAHIVIHTTKDNLSIWVVYEYPHCHGNHSRLKCLFWLQLNLQTYYKRLRWNNYSIL